MTDEKIQSYNKVRGNNAVCVVWLFLVVCNDVDDPTLVLDLDPSAVYIYQFSNSTISIY